MSIRAGQELVRFTDGVTKWVSSAGAQAAVKAGDGVIIKTGMREMVNAARPFAANGITGAGATPGIGQWATDPQTVAMAATAPMGGAPLLARSLVNAAAAGGTAAAQGGDVPLNAAFAGLFEPATKLVGGALNAASLAARGKQLVQGAGEMARERLPVGGANIAPPGARRIPIVGPSLVKGSTAAEGNFAGKLAARDAANVRGPSIPAAPMEQKLADMEANALGRSDRSAQLAALKKRFSDFVDVWQAGQLSAPQAQQFLTSLDEEAKPLFEAMGQRGVRIPPADQIVAQQAKQLSSTLRKTMNTLVTGHRATSTALSNAIAARDAIKATESVPGIGRIVGRSVAGSTLGGAIGAAASPDHARGGAEGALLGLAAMNSPTVMSRLGLLATDPIVALLARQFPGLIVGHQNQ